MIEFIAGLVLGTVLTSLTVVGAFWLIHNVDFLDG